MIPTRIEHAAPVRAIPHDSRISAPYRPIVEIDANYSRLPIEAGFNWSEAFSDINCGAWYLVVFRSRHRPDADDAYLTWLDERASHAASQHPGFLYYFIGTPRRDGHCLSFCLWHSRRDAVVAAADPAHQEAMVRGLPFFEHYRLDRYEVRKRHGNLMFLPLSQSVSSSQSTAPIHSGPA